MGSNQPWGWIKVIYHRDCTIYSKLDISNKYFFLCQVFTANHFFSIVIDNELINPRIFSISLSGMVEERIDEDKRLLPVNSKGYFSCFSYRIVFDNSDNTVHRTHNIS